MKKQITVIQSQLHAYGGADLIEKYSRLKKVFQI